MKFSATTIYKMLGITFLGVIPGILFAQIKPADSTQIMSIDSTWQPESHQPSIQINKEYLVQSYALTLVDLDTHHLEINDSANITLSQQVGGVHTLITTQYQLQFWEHPLHLFGYKTANNIVVIYGLEPQENCEIIKLQDKIYLRYIQLFFELEPSFRYVEFKNVSNPYTLEILQSQYDSIQVEIPITDEVISE